eukprot:1213268-Rhodomonas_salina.2
MAPPMHLGLVPGMGKLSMALLDEAQSAETKHFFVEKHRKGGMNSVGHFPEHVRRMWGLEHHEELGATKLKDCIALWKPVAA